MAKKTYFVVQAFVRGARGAIVAKQAVEAQSKEHAARMAQRMALSSVGAVAFSRAGDPATGDYDDAEVIGVYGTIPEEVLEASAA